MALNQALLDKLKQSKNRYSQGGDAKKIKEGKTRIRVLRNSETEVFWRDLGIHWIKTAVNGKPVAVVGCSEHVKGEPCPICTAIADAASFAQSSGDDDVVKMIKEWNVKKSILINALIRDGSDANENQPVILELAPSVWAKIADQIGEFAAADINMLDPGKEGMDFIVSREGSGLNTKYDASPAPKSSPINPDVLTRLQDLDAYIDRQFFKGEEAKALRAIGSVTGQAAPLLAAPGSARRLTQASVPDAEVIDVAPTTPAVVELTPQQLLAQAQAKKAREAQLAAANAAANAPVAAKPAAPAATTVVDEPIDLDNADVDAMLADLDGLVSAK